MSATAQPEADPGLLQCGAPLCNTRTTFGIVAVFFVVAAWLLTSLAPIALSIAIVFLFAGPHNYVEARYFLTRLPARMGALRPFFVVSAIGIVTLTAALPVVARLPGWLGWPPWSVLWLIGCWNTALIAWCTLMVSMRSRTGPRRDWDYAWPIGLAVIGFAWLQPIVLPVLLVFLHPLMGLWVLDREITKSRPEWRAPYRRSLKLLPAFIAMLWLVGPVANLDANWLQIPTKIKHQIVQHSGASVLVMANASKLVATHAFLELLHYGVWIMAIPAVSQRVFAEGFRTIPLMKRSVPTRVAIKVSLSVSAIIVATLWLCFLADYSTTRDVYFTVATLHVLAEVPFLLRLL